MLGNTATYLGQREEVDTVTTPKMYFEYNEI